MPWHSHKYRLEFVCVVIPAQAGIHLKRRGRDINPVLFTMNFH